MQGLRLLRNRMLPRVARQLLHVLHALRLTAALLASALFVVRTNRHRLQRRFDQTECNTQIVQPVLDFLFHGAPFRVVPSDRNSEAASH